MNEDGKIVKKENNLKKIIVPIILFILIILVGIFFLIDTINKPKDKSDIISDLTNSSMERCKSVEDGYCFYKGIPEFFKFKEIDSIDDSELYNFSKNPFSEYFISEEENDYSSADILCADTGKLPEIIWYFEKICDENEASECAIHWRNAKICENFYVVLDYDSLGYGYTMYGPYDL